MNLQNQEKDVSILQNSQAKSTMLEDTQTQYELLKSPAKNLRPPTISQMFLLWTGFIDTSKLRFDKQNRSLQEYHVRALEESFSRKVDCNNNSPIIVAIEYNNLFEMNRDLCQSRKPFDGLLIVNN